MDVFLLTYLTLCGFLMFRAKWLGSLNHKAIRIAGKKDMDFINQYKFDKAIFLDLLDISFKNFCIQIFTITKWTIKDFYPFLED